MQAPTTVLTDNQKLKKIREALPYHYASTISRRLAKAETFISATQVRLVFAGKITDTEKVLPVLYAANVLYEECKKVNALKG